MPRTRKAKRFRTFFASAYVPMALAMLVILTAAIFADRQTRQNARERQRAEAMNEANTLSSALEQAIRAESRHLLEIGFAFVGTSDLETSDFAHVARSVVDGPSALSAIAVEPLGQPPMHRGTTFSTTLALSAAPPMDGVDRAGTRAMQDTETPSLLIWLPLRAPAADGTSLILGRVVGLLDLGRIQEEAGLTADINDFAVIGDTATTGSPNVHLGNPAVLDAMPVRTSVMISGGDWQLAYRPPGGWSNGAQDVGLIWLLTLVAMGLNLGLTLWAIRLSRERQKNFAALRDREVQLRRVSHRLGLALDASKVGVWDYEIDRGILVWDRRMDELYDMPPDGRARSYADWVRRLHPEDRARARAEFDAAIEASGHYASVFRLVLSDGTIRHIRAIGAVYVEADGRARVVGVNWDATADVELNAELEARRSEAEAASVAKSQFLATMSHEIRTPMNGVIGMLDLMLREPLAPAQRERARVASVSARQLLALLNDVLDFSKLEANRLTLDPRPTDVTALARDVVALMSATAQKRGIQLDLRTAPGIPENLLCDPGRLRQVLINLVGNAIKFTESGSVEVDLAYVTDPRPDLRVVVRDTGIGIAEEARAALFQRFSQIDSLLTRQSGGTGLGLAICRELVELMGGEIAVDSVPGLGSAFHFHIPVETATAPPAPPPAAAATPLPRAKSARILVAEDNATNRHVLGALLAIDGHRVTMVTDGIEALTAIQRETFDLVILDIQMPRMDGITAARAIRALDGPAADLPIIALTANALDADRRNCLAAGMTDYVAKPVSAETLGAALFRALADPGKRRAADARPLDAGLAPR